MAKNKKRVNNTTKNTKKNVYKTKSNYVPLMDALESVAADATDEDFALIQAKVLTQSNDKLFEHVIEMLQSGIFEPVIDDCREKLSNEYPIFKGKIMEREMFVVTMFLTNSLMSKDTATINDWANNFKENPVNIFMKVLKLIEFVRSDKDLSTSLTKLDKIVDWNS
jgi:hypothetical protein